MDRHLRAALKLHEYLVDNHWRDEALLGSDPGIRFNYRIGRFIKSYLPLWPWRDALYYLQGQSYWSLGNWALFARTGEAAFRDIALRCSENMLRHQRQDGAWDYPNPEWKGRTATVEGTWASIGLLEAYRQTDDRAFLAGVLKWREYLVKEIGFQRKDDEVAVNYFANFGRARVPNVSITVLRFLAELAEATGDDQYTEQCAGLLTFIDHVQQETGEFPYAVGSANGTPSRPHLQCYQYNAFECINLCRYYELTGDKNVLPLIVKLLAYLSEGLADDGHVYYDCDNRYRAVTYHAAAYGAAFTKASRLGLVSGQALAERAFDYVLNLQRSDGGFVHSRRDYYVLSDRGSYPRYLAMIMYHLLYPAYEPDSAQNSINQPG